MPDARPADPPSQSSGVAPRRPWWLPAALLLIGAVLPAVEVTSPTATALWRHGDTGLGIRWTPSLGAAAVDLWLVRDGAAIQRLAAAVPDAAGLATWAGPVPKTWPAGSGYRIRIQQIGGAAFGLSESFRVDSATPSVIVITDPGIDDVWWTGRDGAVVAWRTDTVAAPLNLVLERGGSAGWIPVATLASGLANSGRFAVPPIPAGWGTGSSFRIRAVAGTITGATQPFALLGTDPGIIRGPVSGLIPLTDLGARTYKGMTGGLYGAAGDQPDAVHRGHAVAALTGVVPRAADGAPDAATGIVGMISVGYSNSTQEFAAFQALASSDPRRDPRLVIVDGAQGSRDAPTWGSRQDDSDTWQVLDARLAAAGVAAAQVQVLWIKQAIRLPHLIGAWPAHGDAWQAEMGIILRTAAKRFPNLRVAYLATRTYGGWYELAPASPEPFAYELGFAARALITAQAAGRAGLRHGHDGGPREIPLLLWGPYLWADGENPRGDGLRWPRSDFEPDGIHPSADGEAKVAIILRDWFAADQLARSWYLAPDPGALRFTAAAATVGEGAGTLTLTVQRPGDGSGAVAVHYALGSGTATVGADVAAASGVLTWADGDVGDRHLTVAILADDAIEGPETCTVALTAPSGGATLGTPATVTVTIADDDAPARVAVLGFAISGTVAGPPPLTVRSAGQPLALGPADTWTTPVQPLVRDGRAEVTVEADGADGGSTEGTWTVDGSGRAPDAGG